MSDNNEFNKYRDKFISDLSNNVFPVVSAYYYYVNNVSEGDVVDYHEFHNAFFKAIEGGMNIISLEFEEPRFDYEEIEKILMNYYSVHTLYDKNNNLVKIV